MRRGILSTDEEIGEEIKWNAPTFFYAGKMKPTNPKEYRRYIIVFDLFKQECIRLVFPSEAKVKDASRYWKAAIRMTKASWIFYSSKDVKSKAKALRAVITQWLKLLEK